MVFCILQDELGSCHESAEKLDIMMVLMLEYVQAVCFLDGEASITEYLCLSVYVCMRII